MKKTSNYYVIVNKKNGKMLLQGCKCPIYWNMRVALKTCELFKGYIVKKIPANQFNNLIESCNV